MNITEETRTFRGKTINVMFTESCEYNASAVTCEVKLKIDDFELTAYGDFPTKERAYTNAIADLQYLLKIHAAGKVIQSCEKECQCLSERLKKTNVINK